MRLLTIILIITSIVWGGPVDRTEVRMWSRIISDIKLDQYRVFTLDPEISRVLEKIEGIVIVDSCKDATLAIESREYPLTDGDCGEIPRISNDYRLFLKDRYAIGAFFWLKSRPTILFSKQRLKEFNIELDEEMKQYVESML